MAYVGNILVTGATGLLGSSLVPLLKERGHQVIGLGWSFATDLNIDLTCHEQTAQVLAHVEPIVIINLTALTNVDRCETHPQEAYLLNVKAVENLCSWIKRAGRTCFLIQVSTDQVYDGLGPHEEENITIRNTYALSKLAGEFVAGTVPSVTLRTNFVGPSLRKGRTGFTDWLYSSLRNRSVINVFEDVCFSPISIKTLCDCIDQCISIKPNGVFNLGSRDGMSKADFAFAFAAALGLPATNLKRVSGSSVATLVAKRPSDMRMNSARFERVMARRLPLLNEEIKLIAADYY